MTLSWFDAVGDGAIVEIDLARGVAIERLRWFPPPHLRVPTKGFTGACWGRSTSGEVALYVAHHAAIVRVDPVRWKVTGVLHHPCFNDLHDVATDGSRLYVANTGAESLDIFTLDGTFVGSHALLPLWINRLRETGAAPSDWAPLLHAGWTGLAPEWNSADDHDPYLTRGTPWCRAKVRDRLHPCHVHCADGRLLVTCLHDGSIRDLAAFEVLASVRGHPHDGMLVDGVLWYTTVDGTIHAPDAVLDATAAGHHGWCRGLHVSEGIVTVGFSEVRPGRPPKYAWNARGPTGSETSVLAIDRATGELAGRVDLTDRARHSKVFAVLPAEAP